MLKKIKHKLTWTEDKKRLAGNIFSLGVLQGANYILPLLTLPYLVRVLGPEYLGLLAFATATNTYFMLITDYGFNLSATRQVSIHRDNQDKVNEIFSSVMIIKTGLLALSFGLMYLLVFSFEKFSQHWEVYFITFGMVIGQVLFPVWLFQGMEKMKYITYLDIGAKTFFTIFIFFFVKEQADYLLVPLLTTIGFIVSGICSLYLVKKEFNVRFVWQSTATLKFQLTEGQHVFFTNMAKSLYTNSTTILLGLLTNNTILGYFAVANKVVEAVKRLNTPVSQAIYPFICKKIQENKQAGLEFIYKTTWYVGIGMFVISLLLFLLADPIIIFLFGTEYGQSVLLLEIMAFLPFLIAISNMMATQGLYSLGLYILVNKIVIFVSILHIILLQIMILYFNELGAALIMVFSEILMTLLSIYYLKISYEKNNY